MSYAIVEPELLTLTAADVAGIGASLKTANAAAAAPTMGLLGPGADEISAAITDFLNVQAREYQAISNQLTAAINARFVQALTAAAQWYAGTEAAIVASLQHVERQLQGIASLLANGGRPPQAPSTAVPTEPTTPTTPTAPTPSGLSATYTTASQWDGGFIGKYTITNSTATPINNWQLQFTMPTGSAITGAWGGQLASSGQQYTFTPVDHNATIAPGTSIDVGFQAAHSGAYAPPTNSLVNGSPVTTTPTTPTTPTGGTVISTQYGTTTVTGGYVVQNNAWNNPASQTINVTPTGFSITQMNGSAPTNGAPLGYPSIYEGVHYGTSSVGTNLPIQLGQINSATTSIDYNYVPTGTWNASYDIWLDSTYTTTGVNDQEIMIWFNHQGPIQPVGATVGNATINGKTFVVWDGSNGQNNVMSYVATEPIEVWTFDVMDFVDHTSTMEPINDSWYLTSIQAGFEPWSGGVGLGVDSFSANVN